MLAMRRDRRAGLLFLDGHADFYQPEAEPNGEAASMELALATGRGPEIVTDLEGLRPLVRDEDVVALGIRDAELAETHGSQRIEDTDIEVIDLAFTGPAPPLPPKRRSPVSKGRTSTASGFTSTPTRSTMR
jgi:arginase